MPIHHFIVFLPVEIEKQSRMKKRIQALILIIFIVYPSINTLKAISPRKGNKDNYFYQNGGKEDSATEEKIAQILFEAQKQMQAKDRNLNVSFFLIKND